MRYGALRSSCLGMGRDCSSQPRGAASWCAASAHSITVAPAPTVTSPMPRTTGFVLSFRATRSPSRDSSNGTTACIATAPSVQTSMPTARRMRFTPESMAASKPSRAGVSTHPGPLSPDQLASPPTVGKRPLFTPPGVHAQARDGCRAAPSGPPQDQVARGQGGPAGYAGASIAEPSCVPSH